MVRSIHFFLIRLFKELVVRKEFNSSNGAACGAYFDCSLTDPTKTSREPVNNYISDKHLVNLSLLDFYNKSFSMGVGIKLRLAFVKTPICLPFCGLIFSSLYHTPLH
jgi:hypothetical protein